MYYVDKVILIAFIIMSVWKSFMLKLTVILASDLAVH